MNLQSHCFYHLYNQGNNRRTIFFAESDYRYFLQLVHIRLLPFSDVAAWCLMPNHFHFLIRPKPEGLLEKKVGNLRSTNLSNGLRLLQSQYGQYLNAKKGWSGSVFRPKPKWMEMKSGEQIVICFHYIHQNPERAGLVLRNENWPFTSLRFYMHGEMDGICSPADVITAAFPESTNSDFSIRLPDKKLRLVRPVFP